MRAPEPLVLVGCGGLGRETAEVVHAINARAPRWELIGFLDDDPAYWGDTVSGVAVLGGIDELCRFPDARVVVCTANPTDFGSRARIVKRLALPMRRYATLVHPAAALPRSRRVGHGTMILAGVVATADVAIGAHVALMPHVVLTHDDHVGAYATIGAGARLAGGVHVSEGAYLGAGCLIREGCRIGRRALVGMGAVVLSDVPADEVWAGVPARFLRSARSVRA